MNPQPKNKQIKLTNKQYKLLKEKVSKRDKNICQLCYKYTKASPHHVIFRSQGGSDVIENLITLCHKCHTELHSGKQSKIYRQRAKDKMKEIMGMAPIRG